MQQCLDDSYSRRTYVTSNNFVILSIVLFFVEILPSIMLNCFVNSLKGNYA
jgi:hypothetical protein